MEEQTKNRINIEEAKELYTWLRYEGYTTSDTIDALYLMELGLSFVCALKQIIDRKTRKKYEEDRNAWHAPLTP